MEDQLRSTWTRRELPILRAALRAIDAGETPVPLEPIRAELGIPGMEMHAAIDALANAEPPYIGVSLTMGWSANHASGHIIRVYERARRELGTWPTAESLISELAEALRQAAEAAPEPEAKGTLRSAADALSGFARDVAVAVVARHVGG